jgi:signal transduction histidine kinase
MFEIAILITACILNGFLGLTVLLKNPKSTTNRLFFMLTGSFIAWSLINYASVHPAFLPQIEWIRFVLFNASILCLLVFLTFLSFPEIHFSIKKSNYAKNAVYFTLLVMVLTLTPLVFKGTSVSGASVNPIPAPGIVLFLIQTVGLLIAGIVVLVKKYKNAQGLLRNQLRLILWGIGLTFAFIVSTNFLIVVLFHITSFIRFGPAYTFIFTMAFAYAIIRLRLFDIRLVIARSLGYTFLLFAFGTYYAAVAFSLGGKLFKNSTLSTAQEFYYVLLTLLVAFTFQPMRRFFQRVTDRVFYHDHYDPESFLSNLGAIMAREIELKPLSDHILKELTNQMRLSKASIIVLDKNEIFFEGSSELVHQNHMSTDSLGGLNRGVIVRDALDSKDVSEVYMKHDIEVSVGLNSNNEFIGYLLLGAKKSGDIFTNGDIKTLRILANGLAVAIHNAKSYTQIQNFNKTLQAKVDEATKQLRDANAHLKELDEIKNEFLSMATHQLNTPLTVVDGYLSMITDGTIKDPKEQTATLQKMVHRVRMMKHLVTDFLNVSRIEAGTFIIEPTPVDLNKLISEQVSELGPEAQEKEVFLRFFAPEHPLPLVEVDEQKISQAVMNLIDNAIYYTPKGNVSVYLNSDAQNIIFKVVDNGIGVPDAYKDKLFQKFARADNAKKQRPSGNGVGLYLVKLVVEAHGGSIIFESAEGKGSTFGFTIPMKVKEDLHLHDVEPQPKEKEAVAA